MHVSGSMRLVLSVAATLVLSGCGDAGTAQGAATGPNDAPDPYHLDAGWAKTAIGRNFGSTIGVQIDPDGSSVWTYDRCGGNTCEGSEIAPIQKFDGQGNLVAAIGAGLTNFPHGFAVEKDGTIWITDATGADGKGNTVMKLSPTGEVLMTLGMPGVAGETENTFNRPSSVAIGADGSIYVGDGHGGDSNARIVKFDANGNFVKTWGHFGTGPGEFDQPHAMAIDSQGRLFVADRNNNRIQIFDADGNFLDQWHQFGRPSGVFIDGNDMIYVADSQSDEMTNPGFEQGIRIGSVTDGVVREFIHGPEIDGQAGEGVAADAAGHVYVGFTGGHNFKRFSK